MFLGKRREDEVRLRYWQESTVCLRAFAAPKAAGAYRNLGLLNLITRSLRIKLWIQKAGEALLLVSLQYMNPGNEKYSSDADYSEQTHSHALFPLHATEKDAHDRDWNIGQGC